MCDAAYFDLMMLMLVVKWLSGLINKLMINKLTPCKVHRSDQCIVTAQNATDA